MNDSSAQRIYNENYTGGNGMNKTENYEPCRISVTEHDDFNPTYETRLMRTQDLCRKINGLFKNAIGDYFGSTLLPNPTTGQMELAIYLKDLGKSDKIKMIEPVVNMNNPRQNDMGSRIANLNSRNMGRTIQLSKEGKEIFEEFLMKTHYNAKINWNQHAVECSENVASFGNKYNIYLKLSNLNLQAVLAKIWGEKAPEGGKYEYQLVINRPIPGTNDFIVTVQRFHNGNIEEFATQVGLTPTVGTFNIVR